MVTAGGVIVLLFMLIHAYAAGMIEGGASLGWGLTFLFSCVLADLAAGAAVKASESVTKAGENAIISGRLKLAEKFGIKW